LHVSAAASLTESFTEIATGFEVAHPGSKVEFSFAGSQILRTQIEQGAEVDVFASADQVQMDPLVKAKLVGKPRVFAHNKLAAVASTKTGTVRSLGDLSKPGVTLVVAGSTVPVGRYTTQLVGKMGASGLYGDDFASRFNANVMSHETNVRAVLMKVSLGEADAGIVYATDIRQSDKVTVLEIPERMNVIATYPIAVTHRSKSKEMAEAFVLHVLSPEGQAILRKWGFVE
jgi:molybdate transport system substrate-binding protein